MFFATSERAISNTVYYITDRNYVGGNTRFGTERALGGLVSFGSIDYDPHSGNINADSGAPIASCNIAAMTPSCSTFLSRIVDAVEQSPTQRLLIYVHGFNNTFQAALQDAIMFDRFVNDGGIVVFFSWPSKGTLQKYLDDETQATWSAPHFSFILKSILDSMNGRTTDVISHSLGSRLIAQALFEESLRHHAGDPTRVQQVIFHAADIDRDTLEQYIEAFASTVGHVTMYTSSHDLAMMLSERLHGHARGGQAGTELLTGATYDTIDASYVPRQDGACHDYKADPIALGDMRELLSKGTPIYERANEIKVRRPDAKQYYELYDPSKPKVPCRGSLWRELIDYFHI
ncbi:MAG: alpha/beta hydrolase [Candidatus Eremiobacteraeota bacterium]|nr:alpha/beta hydrolase [Candidatus Eremiobacteraeota bacterium]